MDRSNQCIALNFKTLMYMSVDFSLSRLYTMDIAGHDPLALPILNTEHRHSRREMRGI